MVNAEAGEDVAGAHRVLLVGPWRGSATSGGCCSADAATLAEPDPAGSTAAVHNHDRVIAADVVRALRSAADASVDVELVDPRNTVFVLPAVYRDARRRGTGIRAALTEAVRATTPWALVIDGKVVSRSLPLTPAAAVGLLPADFTS
ncbi:MAG: hypothetical protein ACRDQW_10590 [Haloechinothrix sp.]